MIIRNVLHPHLINGNIFFENQIGSRMIKVGTVDNYQVFTVSRIDVVFNLAEFQTIPHHFPLRLAFGATVHNIQGQTLSRVVADIIKGFFVAGQLCVDLSRTKRTCDILLLR